MKSKMMPIVICFTLTLELAAGTGDFTAELENADSLGHAMSARLAFASGASGVLYVGYGNTDGGNDLASWENCRAVTNIHPSQTSLVCDLPFLASGSYRYARFFLLDDALELATPRYEYLEFDGGQYVDTGFVLSSDSTIEMSASLSNTDETECIFCAREWGSHKSMTLFYIANSGWRYDFGYEEGVPESFAATANEKYRFVADAGKLTVDGAVMFDKSFEDFSTEHPLWLFAAGNQWTSIEYKAKGRIYSFRLWDGGRNLKMDLVPTSTNGVACFYDRVGGRYVGHSGEGGLVCGPAKASPDVTGRSNTLEGKLGSGRTFTVEEVTREDKRTALVSARLSVSPGPKRWLYAAYGLSDGEDTLSDWSEVLEIGPIEASNEAVEQEVRFPDGWNETWAVVRLFLLDKDYTPGIDRLEYVLATGSQHVRTGFTPTQDVKTEFDVQFSTVAESQTLFCAREWDRQTNTVTLFYIANTGWRYDFNKWQHSSDVTAVADARYCVRTGTYSLDVDGASVFPELQPDPPTFSAGSDLTLFAAHTAQVGYEYPFKGRLYSFRAWSNGVDRASLTLDLVPCSSNGVVCLYNRVDGRYLAGEGSALVGGPSVSDGQVLWSSDLLRARQRRGFAISVR